MPLLILISTWIFLLLSVGSSALLNNVINLDIISLAFWHSITNNLAFTYWYFGIFCISSTFSIILLDPTLALSKMGYLLCPDSDGSFPTLLKFYLNYTDYQKVAWTAFSPHATCVAQLICVQSLVELQSEEIVYMLHIYSCKLYILLQSPQKCMFPCQGKGQSSFLNNSNKLVCYGLSKNFLPTFSSLLFRV